MRVCADDLPPKTSSGPLGEIIPGKRVWDALTWLGLVLILEEEPIDIDGTPFFFTPIIEITDAGRRALRAEAFDPTFLDEATGAFGVGCDSN
ncbi:hypothetical protein [Ensifer sp. LCM 4579]|uniref:hypothetical protein n=1 Tax=Ensifer sp. LCM 4579 TaxID=1848292 RepID=UPI0008DA02CB|nr:hypothetical protein [Ensifer sp. LCM 4579]OHV80382.1 hypothetical protein LCM4579_22620 [Ensifer sp. LCM 4579]